MKLLKGMVIGGLVTAGIITMYMESDMIMNNTPKKIMKKGKKFIRKIGIM